MFLNSIDKIVPFGIKNIQKLCIVNTEKPFNLPIYVSVKKPGQAIVKENEDALDTVFQDVLSMAVQEGLVSEEEAKLEKEKDEARKQRMKKFEKRPAKAQE